MGYLLFFANYGYKPSIRLPLTIENPLEEGLQQAKRLQQTHKEGCRCIEQLHSLTSKQENPKRLNRP